MYIYLYISCSGFTHKIIWNSWIPYLMLHTVAIWSGGSVGFLDEKLLPLFASWIHLGRTTLGGGDVRKVHIQI